MTEPMTTRVPPHPPHTKYVSNLHCASSFFQVLAELQDNFVANRKKGLKRRFWIRRNVELRQYGFTDGCPGCEAAEKRAKAVGHTEVCRKRVEAKMLAQETCATKQLRKRSREVVKATEASPASSEHQTRGDKCDHKGGVRRARRPRQTK